MRLSVIVPVYNMELYIEKCINSIIKSDTNNYDFEIICINDGSSDSSLKILNRFKENNNRKIKIINIENSGVSNARNIGISEAKGDYITFVDSDDWVEESFLDDIFYNLEKNINTDLFIFNTKFVSDKCFDKKEKITDTVFNTENHACCKVFKKDIIFKENIKFPINIKLGEDMVFTFKYIFNANRIKYIDKTLYFYRLNREGSTMSTQVNKLYKQIFLACDELYNYCIEKDIMWKYQSELEYLFIKNILIRNTPKIIKNNKNITLIIREIDDELKYMEDKFPSWIENIYMNNNSDKYCSDKLGIYFKKTLSAMKERKYITMVYYFILGKLKRKGE